MSYSRLGTTNERSAWRQLQIRPLAGEAPRRRARSSSRSIVSRFAASSAHSPKRRRDRTASGSRPGENAQRPRTVQQRWRRDGWQYSAVPLTPPRLRRVRVFRMIEMREFIHGASGGCYGSLGASVAPSPQPQPGGEGFGCGAKHVVVAAGLAFDTPGQLTSREAARGGDGGAVPTPRSRTLRTPLLTRKPEAPVH